jgi:hypothetical protein
MIAQMMVLFGSLAVCMISSIHVRAFQFDVVSLAIRPTCVSSHAIEGLNKHLHVRKIHIITASYTQCIKFFALASNIECHLESDLVPGVSLQSVRAYLGNRFGDKVSQDTARERGGWYLQQILKLGSAFAIQGLSEHYMIWDLDMIPIQPFPVVFEPVKMEMATRTRVDISAVQIREYAASYKRLFNKPVEYPLPGMSYVAHWMMVYKPYMLEMLWTISRDDPVSWPWKILDSVQPGYRNVYYGLSEYTMYISWVIQNKPGSFEVMHNKEWNRVAPRKHEWLLKHKFMGCCPDDDILKLAAKMDWNYFGWELGKGHSPECENAMNPV